MILPNAKHELFAQHVAAGKALAEAAVLAGYSVKSKGQISSKLAHKSEVSARIGELKAAICEASSVDAAFLLSHLGNMLTADIGDIVDEQTGAYKPIHQWPKIWRQMLKGLDIEEQKQRSADGVLPAWDVVGRIVKIKYVDVLQAIEITGRHKTVDAFVHQQAPEVHLHLHAEVESRLSRAREIAAHVDDVRRD